MNVTSSIGRIPTRTVHVADVAPTDTKDDILNVALSYTGETRNSCFGWTVDTDEGSGTSVVRLFTD